MTPELITWAAFCGGVIIGVIVTTLVTIFIIIRIDKDNSDVHRLPKYDSGQKADPASFLQNKYAK